jgi:hypothetical protein
MNYQYQNAYGMNNNNNMNNMNYQYQNGYGMNNNNNMNNMNNTPMGMNSTIPYNNQMMYNNNNQIQQQPQKQIVDKPRPGILWNDSFGKNKHEKNKTNQLDFLCEANKAVKKIHELQIKDMKEKFSSRNPVESIKAEAKEDNWKKMALSEGYTAIGTDFHGSFISLYSFLVNSSFIIPDYKHFQVVDFTTGNVEGIFRIEGAEKNEDYIRLCNSEKNKERKLVVLPLFRLNDKIKEKGGKAELLGDYIDRGGESGMCLAMVQRVAEADKKRAEEEKTKRHFFAHYGNHENFDSSASGLIARMTPEGDNYRTAIKNMKENGYLKACSFEPKLKENEEGKLEPIPEEYTSYSHTILCKKHVPKMFGILSKFKALEEAYDAKSEKFNKDFVNKIKELARDKYENWLKIYKKHVNNYIKFKGKAEYKELFDKIGKVKLEELEKKDYFKTTNFQGLCDLLGKSGFKETDYFELKNLISSVAVDLNGSEFERFIYNGNGKEYYDTNISQAIKSFYTSGEIMQNTEVSYFGCISDDNGNGGFKKSWFTYERYVPEENEKFTTVDQVQGHCNPEKEGLNKEILKNPYVNTNTKESKKELSGKGDIIVADNAVSYGFRKNTTLSTVTIRRPNGSLLLVNYECPMKDNGLPDSENIKAVETGMALKRKGDGFVSKKDSEDEKKFSSTKGFAGAFGESLGLNPKEFTKERSEEVEKMIKNETEKELGKTFESIKKRELDYNISIPIGPSPKTAKKRAICKLAGVEYKDESDESDKSNAKSGPLKKIDKSGNRGFFKANESNQSQKNDKGPQL